MGRTEGGGGGYGQHTAAVKDGLVAQEHDGRRAGPGHQNPCMDHFPIRYYRKVGILKPLPKTVFSEAPGSPAADGPN